jgi:hypothetical protein
VFCQPQQTIDQGCQIPQARLQMTLDTMIQLFGMKQLSHPTQIGFDGEALIPRVAFAAVDVGWRRIFRAQAQVSQRYRFTVVGCRQGAKDVIRLVGSIPRPVDHLTRIVDQPGQFDADDPAPVRLAFLPIWRLLRPSRRG